MLGQRLEQLVGLIAGLNPQQHRRWRWLRFRQRQTDHHHIILAHPLQWDRLVEDDVQQDVAEIGVRPDHNLDFRINLLDVQRPDAPIGKISVHFDEQLAALRKDAVLFLDRSELHHGRFIFLVILCRGFGFRVDFSGRFESYYKYLTLFPPLRRHFC